MSFFAKGAKKLVAKFLGREGVSFPFAPALGRSWKGQSCRTDAPLAAVVTPNSATGIPYDFRAPESCDQCLCYCQSTALS